MLLMLVAAAACERVSLALCAAYCPCCVPLGCGEVWSVLLVLRGDMSCVLCGTDMVQIGCESWPSRLQTYAQLQIDECNDDIHTNIFIHEIRPKR